MEAPILPPIHYSALFSSGDTSRSLCILCNMRTKRQLRTTIYRRKDRFLVAAMQALAGIHHVETNQERQDVLKAIVPEFLMVILHNFDYSAVLKALGAIDQLFVNQCGICENRSLVDDAVFTLSQLLLSKARIQGSGDEFCRIRDDINGCTSSLGYHIFRLCTDRIIPNMVEEMKPEMAAKSLQVLFPLLLSKTDPHCSIVNRSMAIRALGRVVGRLGNHGRYLLDQLVPVLVRFCSSDDEEVRRNAFTALHNCVLRCNRAVFTHYSEILSIQRKCLSNDNDPDVPTACATVAAMIVTSGGSMIAGLDDVIPVILQTLDPANYRNESLRVVIQCLSLLHQAGNSLMKEHICRVLDFVLFIVSDGAGDIEGRAEGTKLLVSLKTAFPEEYCSAAGKLSPETLQELENQSNF